MADSCFFHFAGHSILSHILVHRVRRVFFPFGPEFVINSYGMPSSPGAFTDFICLIASFTSAIKGMMAWVQAFVGVAVQVESGMSTQSGLCGKGCLPSLVMKNVPAYMVPSLHDFILVCEDFVILTSHT